MPYGFVRIFLFFIYFFILPPPRFPDDNFWPPSRTAPELNRSHVMVIGRSVLFSDPARPPGGGVGRPKHPKIPPRKIFLFACVSEPQEHFWKKNLVGKFFFFFFFFLRFKTPGTFLSEKKCSVKYSTPPPTCTPPPSLQNTHPNSRAIINNPNNCSRTYRL